MQRYLFSLRQKVLLALSLILLPVVIASVYGYYRNRELLRERVIHDLTLAAEAFEGQVYQFIEMSKRRADDFASDGFTITALTSKARLSELKKYLLEKRLPLDTHIKSICVISKKGIVITSTDDRYVNLDFSHKDFFIKGIKGSAATEVIDVTGEPQIALSSPIVDANGQTIGVLANHIRLSELNAVLSGEFNRELGAISWQKGHPSTMNTYIVNRNGNIIAGSMLTDRPLPDMRVQSEPVAACTGQKKEISGFYSNHLGKDVVGASMCIPSLGWTLVTEYSADEAMAATTEMRREAAMAAMVLGGLIILLFVFFKSIIEQIRKLSTAAAAVAAGDYDITIPITTQDEIGQLAEAFNDMARDIKKRGLDLEESHNRLEAILNNAAAVVYLKDIEGRYIFANRKYEELLNMPLEQIKGRTDHELFPDEIADPFRENDLKVIEAKGPIEFEETAPKDGSLHTYLSIKFPLFNAEGGVYAICGLSTDITERIKAAEVLKQTEERLTTAQRIGRIGSWDWHIQEDTLWWSDEIYEIFGLEPNEFAATYEAFIHRVHPEDRELVKRAVKEAVHAIKPYSLDHRVMHPDGKVLIVHGQGDVYFDDTGIPLRMVGTLQDVTEQREKDMELKKLSMTLEQSVNLIFITDSNGVIEYVNPMFEKVTGYSSEDAIGQNPKILASGDVTNDEYKNMWETILDGRTWRGNYKNRKKNGGYYWCSTVISPIKNENGRITHFLAVQEDMTQKKLTEERIKYLARHDELTGLYNRTSFIELLDEWIDHAAASNEEGTLLLMDMDNFKYINDTYGMGVGDDFLIRLSKHLTNTLDRIKEAHQGAMSREPVLSRTSGDEFAVLLPSFTEAEGLEAAEEFRAGVEGFAASKPPISTTASIGVVSYPHHGTSSHELLTRADTSMYRAKELGRNKTHLFRPEDRDLEKLHSRLSGKEKIQKALAEDRFTPWFQPIVSLNDDRVHHFESLARMTDADGKVLLPGSFIDIGERFGLIGAIDRMITKKAMVLQAKTQREGKPFSFSMNLSGKNLGDGDLLIYLKNTIAETGANPDRLIFEITETAAIADLERAIEFIQSLKALGCHFSLDDFGVGFTSFTYLREMKVDYIKIDGSFIRQLTTNRHDQVFVKAMTDVARTLSVKSVAEFVENMDTYLLLKELGVDYAQGYLIGKPEPELIEEDAFITKHLAVHKTAQ